ncbi:hypothetical protein GCM10010339_92840 [Streptomyces alanosinicus]|uniref:Uncharacterized protein n=1 Tax=Streptomyces alanosinicus TaxID=68171 RepID=A0A919D8C1_9ACTN|nr:hypothetical protein GCM10010339_92840 [Streptomyces alanosinicus]
MHVTDVPEDLIELERTAELERARLAGVSGKGYDAQWRRWREASEAAQAAATAHAEETGRNRYELVQSVKKAVRHIEEDSAEYQYHRRKACPWRAGEVAARHIRQRISRRRRVRPGAGRGGGTRRRLPRP